MRVALVVVFGFATLLLCSLLVSRYAAPAKSALRRLTHLSFRTSVQKLAKEPQSQLNKCSWDWIVGRYEVSWGSCASSPCHWNAEIKQDPTTCELSGHMNMTFMEETILDLSNFHDLSLPSISLSSLWGCCFNEGNLAGIKFNLANRNKSDEFYKNFTARGWVNPDHPGYRSMTFYDDGCMEMVWKMVWNPSIGSKSSIAPPVSPISYASLHHISSRLLANDQQAPIQQFRSRQKLAHKQAMLPMPIQQLSKKCSEEYRKQGFPLGDGSIYWWDFVWDYMSSHAGFLPYDTRLSVNVHSQTCEVSMNLTYTQESGQLRVIKFTNFTSVRIPMDTFSTVCPNTKEIPDAIDTFQARMVDGSWCEQYDCTVRGLTFPWGDAPGDLYMFTPKQGWPDIELIHLSVAN